MSSNVAIHQTTFNPNPIQRQFIESRAKADLYSSRMGEGKSTALAWSAFLHTRLNPGAEWYLIRDTWENIQATTMKTFFEWFPPGVYGSYHATKKEFTWAEGVAKGTVGFLGMDAAEDAQKLMSRQMAGFGMDEPAPAVGSVGIDEFIFDLALSRLRQKDMSWYSAKLAINNPDETHWTYRRFVSPGDPEFRLWQPDTPENEQNLPPGYYAELRKLWAHRPDMVRRFVDGEFGFQQVGKAVTPQWSDKFHLATGLHPIKGLPLYILWDFGHNPTAIVTQRHPLGHWLILDALVGDGLDTTQLVNEGLVPLLRERYVKEVGAKLVIHHIGDPSGETGDQSNRLISPVRYIQRTVGGTWRRGPIKPHEGIESLRHVLTRTINGKGVVLVDRHRASAVWAALRGGWHYRVTRTGIVSGQAEKNEHSHPGDAMRYGAAILFPVGKVGLSTLAGPMGLKAPGYFAQRQGRGDPLIRPGPKPPAHGAPFKP